MKSINQVLVLLFFLWMTGCQQRSESVQSVKTTTNSDLPKVVRLEVRSRSANWGFKLNEPGSPTRISDAEIRRILSDLKLHFGDLVIASGPIDFNDPSLMENWRWLQGYCRSNQVAIYTYASFSPKLANHVFSAPVFHWVTPFSDPMTAENAVFYEDGKPLGKGLEGLRRILSRISEIRTPRVFLHGSLYDLGRSFPPTCTPFEDHRKELDEAAQKSDTYLIMHDPDFN